MRITAKALDKELGCSKEQGALALQVLAIADYAGAVDFCERDAHGAYKWIRACLNRPSLHEIQLEALSEILGFCGVYYIEEIGVDCLNAGDPYIATICYKEGEFFISAWGDLVEAAQ